MNCVKDDMKIKGVSMKIHTYHSCCIPEGVAEAFQIFLRVQNYLARRNTTDEIGGKPITVGSSSISGVSAINPLVVFYDIRGRKGEVLLFCSFPDTTRNYAWR
jgi:hypothetical protein